MFVNSAVRNPSARSDAIRSSIASTTVYAPGFISRVDLVTAQFDAGSVGPRAELGLDVGNREFAALGAVPRMVGTARTGAEEDRVHRRERDAVRVGDVADLIVDRRDQHTAEVEDDGLDLRCGHRQSNDAVAT